MGAVVGERREFTLEAERAYGPRDEEAVLQIPRSNFCTALRKVPAKCWLLACNWWPKCRTGPPPS